MAALLSAKPTPTARPSLPPPPGHAYLNVQLVDASGKPETYSRIGPEVFAYPINKDVCGWLARGGGPGTAQDDLVEDWGHANPDGLAHLTVKAPGTYVVFVGGGRGALWWKAQKTCANATPVKVDTTMTIDFVY